MNGGIILKSIRETGPATLLFGLVLLAVEMAFNFVLPTFQEQISTMLPQMKLFQNMIKALTGAAMPPDLAGLGPEVLQSLCWAHPVVLVAVWAHAAIICTRVPASEIERGTIDVLLGLPISRASLFVSESFVWMLSGAALLVFAFVGHRLGSSLGPTELRPALPRVMIVLANLWCLYLAVGGFSWLLSSYCSRRGPAAATVFVVLVVTFVINYLAQFWEPLRKIVWLSLLKYYRPLLVLQDGRVPWVDMAVLLALAALMWGIAAAIFSRRDISTT
jgi:ABC-type transport system involved in multi-copper enzyme maturation permease subunit